MRILDHYGHVYIDRPRNQAFGIDRVEVHRSGQGWELVNESGESRTLRVVFEDGSIQEVQIDKRAFIQLSDT